MQAGNVASPTSIQDCSHIAKIYVKYKYIRKANVGLAVVYGGSWYLILTFVNFTISCSCELRIFIGLETRSLHEAEIINSHIKLRLKSHIKERFIYPRFWISEMRRFMYFYTCTWCSQEHKQYITVSYKLSRETNLSFTKLLVNKSWLSYISYLQRTFCA